MKNGIVAVTLMFSVSMLASAAVAAEPNGEALFKAKCAACHPNGGNIIKATATLKGLKDPKVITKKIRSGGGGMTAFDAKAVSDKDAKLIADYVIKTFKK